MIRTGTTLIGKIQVMSDYCSMQNGPLSLFLFLLEHSPSYPLAN